MNVMDLQTRKIEFIQKFLKIKNEDLITKFEMLIKSEKETIKPFTESELNNRIDQSELDFKQGKFKNSTEIAQKYM